MGDNLAPTSKKNSYTLSVQSTLELSAPEQPKRENIQI